MTFVGPPPIRSVGCVYTGRCVYTPDTAFAHGRNAAVGVCIIHNGWVYAPQGAYTLAVSSGAFTRAWVRIRG
jgi:hypothetical protein